MKKLIILTVLNLLLPLILLIILPSFVIQKRQGTSFDTGDRLLSFVASQPVNFNFISNYLDLQSLSIRMKNPEVKNHSPITFTIIGPNSQRSIIFNGANVGDPSSVPLKFEPFSDPKLTTYNVSLTTTNTDHAGLYLITGENNQPHFNSYYRQSDIKTNLETNFLHQLDLFRQRSGIHNLVYFSLIIMFDILILKSTKSGRVV